jgi:hypothetical protein
MVGLDVPGDDADAHPKVSSRRGQAPILKSKKKKSLKGSLYSIRALCSKRKATTQKEFLKRKSTLHTGFL